MKTPAFASLLVLAAALISSSAGDQNSLDDNLQPLKKFLGTWRGELKNSTAEKPVIDIASWERALNGKAVRVLHSVNEGSYGGETLIYWDSERKTIAYDYYTTAGFRTKGTAKIDGDNLECHEIVTGSQQGITEVKANYELTADGLLKGKSKYLQKGEWVSGHEVAYKRDPDAKVIFN